MAARRSARLRLAEEKTTTPDLTTTSLSRAHAPAAKPKAKRTISTTRQAEETKTQTDARTSRGKDLFSSLPPELMAMVLGHIKTPPAMSVLARTSRSLYHLMMPRLYFRIEVSAGYHAQIAKFIRTIEPLLSISQKKALKKVGQYRGQQERYSKTLDANAVPLNVRFVRQLVVGSIDPGRKHINICIRYLEELMKNLLHLEILYTDILTPSMAESIASMHNLQALSCTSGEPKDEMASPLSQVKNLKHFDFRPPSSFVCLPTDTLRSMLRNSASTLRSLSMVGGLLTNSCFKETGQQGNPRGEWIELTSLHALRVDSFSLEDATPNFLTRSVNLFKLQELEIGHPSLGRDGALLLYSHLINAFEKAPSGSRPALKKLTLNLGENVQQALPPLRFVYSLDTLTSLTIHGFEVSLSAEHPELSDMLQRAILKQQNLRCLRFVCHGLRSQGPLPYMPAVLVRRFVEGLPQLREFEFAPAMDELVYPTRTPEPVDLVGTIVRRFLSHRSEMDAKKLPEERAPFVWEHEFALRRVTVSYCKAFDLASAFTKAKKGSSNRAMQQKHEFIWGDEYRVRYREAPRSELLPLYSGLECVWLEKVQKDLA